MNDCDAQSVADARVEVLQSLADLGIVLCDHLFNVLVRWVGVPKKHWRAVAGLCARFLVDSGMAGKF